MEHHQIINTRKGNPAKMFEERKGILQREGQMIESPVLQKWFAERDVLTRRSVLLESLESRYQSVPSEISAAVRTIDSLARLKQLQSLLMQCVSIDDFGNALNSTN